MTEAERAEYQERLNTIPHLPKPLTFKERQKFEAWAKSEHGFDKDKYTSKEIKTAYNDKDEKLAELFNRQDEWKSAYKIMAKLCHPDAGGNSLAMSFLGDLNELMKTFPKLAELNDHYSKGKDLETEWIDTFRKPRKKRGA